MGSAGSGVDLATLTVTTALDTFPVSAMGEFEAGVLGGASTEDGVESADGGLLLLGVTDGARVDVSLTSTAEALLDDLVGAMWLPDEQQDTVRELLRGKDEAVALEAELEGLRWSTSGNHGSLCDLLEDGDVIETTSREIWYFHDSPSTIEDTDVDTITVDAFEVEPGTTAEPPGVQPVARMVATARGDDRTIDSRIEVHYGATRLGYPCAEMYLRFEPQPGAKTYLVHARHIGGLGDPRNTNQELRPLTIGEAVPLWYQWMKEATFEIDVTR